MQDVVFWVGRKCCGMDAREEQGKAKEQGEVRMVEHLFQISVGQLVVAVGISLPFTHFAPLTNGESSGK